MQYRDPHKFGGLNTDDNPSQLPDGDYTFAKNVRSLSSSQQHGAGPVETLQGEIPVLLGVAADIVYYGQSIGGEFLYSGYSEITIGTQTWMKKNWAGDYPGSKVYDDIEANRNIYGGLYTHNQIMEEDFCPEGWHVPTEAEYDTLLTFLGGAAIAGGRMKEVGDSHWLDPNTAAIDAEGFRALPGGKYDAAFDLLGEGGLLWIADDAAPLPPVALNASEIDYNQFRANWQSSDGADGYRLDVSESPVFASFMMGYEDKDIGSNLSALIEDLEEDTTYYYRVRAYNEVGTSGNSNVISLVTLSALVDMDDNVYRIITVGSQQWLVEALRTTTYANGDAIPNVTDNEDWGGAAVNSVKVTYGALYNWYAATYNIDGASIAPTGWHVPTYAEFNVLLNYVSPSPGALKEAGTSHWAVNAGGTNDSGFTALPGGGRDTVNEPLGSFSQLGGLAFFWFSDISEDLASTGALVIWGILEVAIPTPEIESMGISIRCLMDDPSGWQAGDKVTDIDGNEYDTVQIGTQVWMASNLKVEHFNNGAPIPMGGADPTFFTDAEWAALTTEAMCYYGNAIESTLDGAYCWYNNDIANKDPYGALYNWYAVDHLKKLVEGQFKMGGVVSEGWRTPTPNDLDRLSSFLGGDAIASGRMKDVGTDYWNAPNVGAIDSEGFSLVGSGFRRITGEFAELKNYTFLWTQTEYNDATALSRNLGTYSAQFIIPTANDKRYGFTIRVMRDITSYSRYVEITQDELVKDSGRFRIGVRDGQLVYDQAITELGFNGTIDIDWINLKAIR